MNEPLPVNPYNPNYKNPNTVFSPGSGIFVPGPGIFVPGPTNTRFTDLAAKIGKLCDLKASAYGNGKQDAIGFTEAAFQYLYPDGIPADKIGDVLILVRLLDKVCRIAYGKNDALGEDAWADVIGYGLRGAARFEDNRRQEAK